MNEPVKVLYYSPKCTISRQTLISHQSINRTLTVHIQEPTHLCNFPNLHKPFISKASQVEKLSFYPFTSKGLELTIYHSNHWNSLVYISLPVVKHHRKRALIFSFFTRRQKITILPISLQRIHPSTLKGSLEPPSSLEWYNFKHCTPLPLSTSRNSSQSRPSSRPATVNPSI